MARFNPDDYATVAERIDRFWAKYPNGRIATELVHFDPSQCVVRAEIYTDRDDLYPVTSDYAEERIDGGPVNKTSMVENCVTSSIGRALADLGGEFTGSKRASREEMEKVERLKSAPARQAAPEPVPDTFWTRISEVATLEDLHNLWQEALSDGYSQSVLKDFQKRKEELS